VRSFLAATIIVVCTAAGSAVWTVNYESGEREICILYAKPAPADTGCRTVPR
jgi:hypothetical protein